MKKTIIAVCLTITFILGGAMLSFAHDKDNADHLKAQIKALQERVDQLESQKDSKNNVQDKDSFMQTKGWNPFAEIARMQQHMGQMMQGSLSNRGYSNIGMFRNNMSYDADFKMEDKGKEYVINFDMTGLDENKLDIEVNTHSISIKGVREEKTTEKGQGQYMQKTNYSSFSKAIPVPEDADITKVNTEKKDNMLVITIPKKDV